MRAKVFPIFLLLYICILGNALAIYSWSGNLNVGDQIYVNNLKIYIDMNQLNNKTAAIVYQGTEALTIIYEGEEKTVEGLEISITRFNDYVLVSISSEDPFTISFNATKDYSAEINKLKEENTKLKQENEQLKKQVESLENEDKQLKGRISDLEKQLSQAKAQDVSKLQVQINNLTKENRELKAQIANQTNLINQLKAKAQFLEQQNNEYRTLITKLLEEQAQKSEQSYIEKAKKEKLIGSVIIKSLLFGGIVVGLVGYGLYRKKRSWELT